jgi:hypothetical protein
VYPHAATQAVKDKIVDFTDNLTANVEYVLVDLTSDPSAFAYALNRASTGNYGLYFSDDRILLYRLNYTDSPIVNVPISEIYNSGNLKIGDGAVIADSNSLSGTVVFHSTNPPLADVLWSGPYVSLPPGSYNATFRLKVGSIVNGVFLTLDVAVGGGSTVLAGKVLKVQDFNKPLEWQNFTLSFSLDKPYTDVEFRGLNPSNITETYLDYIQLNSAKYTPISETFDFRDLTLAGGSIVVDSSSISGSVLLHSTAPPLTSAFWFGPYTFLPAGNYSATFRLEIGSVLNGGALKLDVVVNKGTNVLADKYLNALAFNKPMEWQNFTLNFSLDKSYNDVEFRGLNPFNATSIYLDNIQVNQIVQTQKAP